VPGFVLIQIILHANCGQAGDNVGLLLRGLKRGDVERGQVRIPVLSDGTWFRDHQAIYTVF
jgi:elongation factor Tu